MSALRIGALIALAVVVVVFFVALHRYRLTMRRIAEMRARREHVAPSVVRQAAAVATADEETQA